MLDEEARRRLEFHPGIPARLADGRTWMLPGPTDLSAGEGPPDPEYGALLSAVCEAEGPAERARAELALAIYLLGINYDLSSAQYGAILDPPPGGPATALRRAFREAAGAHLDHFRARSAAAEEYAPRARRPGGWAPRRRTANPAG